MQLMVEPTEYGLLRALTLQSLLVSLEPLPHRCPIGEGSIEAITSQDELRAARECILEGVEGFGVEVIRQDCSDRAVSVEFAVGRHLRLWKNASYGARIPQHAILGALTCQFLTVEGFWHKQLILRCKCQSV